MRKRVNARTEVRRRFPDQTPMRGSATGTAGRQHQTGIPIAKEPELVIWSSCFTHCSVESEESLLKRVSLQSPRRLCGLDLIHSPNPCQ